MELFKGARAFSSANARNDGFPTSCPLTARKPSLLDIRNHHAAATHRVVEHAVAILPWPVVLPVRDIVQHGGVPIFSFERSAHDRPEVARDGCPIDNRSDRGNPDKALWIGITQFS